MKKVRFGVIGPGRIANIFCSDLVKSDMAELYAVASRSMEKAQQFAEKYGAVKAYDSYEALADDKEIDIIYIAAPHMLHKKYSLMCKEKGKSVLCEKPAGINERELQEMIECAKENDVFFMEGMWTRLFPISQEIKKIANNGKLGKVRHIEANFGFGSWDDENINNKNHRLFSPDMAGGALLDLGVYCVAFAQWVTGKNPINISALAKMAVQGVDANTVFIYEYEDNCTASLQCSICQNTSSIGRVFFDDGRIELECFYRPFNMEITYGDGRSEKISDNSPEEDYYGFIYEIDHVADCILNGLKESPQHSWKDTLDIVRQMDTIRKQINLKYPFE